MQKALLALPLILLTACGSATDAMNKGVTPAKLRTDTATYFRTSEHNVAVGEIRQTMLGTSYKARIGKVVYDCNHFRAAVSCERAWR